MSADKAGPLRLKEDNITIRYIRIGVTHPCYQKERNLRNTFLLRPIGLPDSAWEMNDADSIHFIALDGEEVVGCVVLYPLPGQDGVVQLMQMAVDDRFRGRGIGKGLVDCLISFSRSQGYCRIVCHSRQEAVGFYKKLGFAAYGESFYEVGIPHSHMQLTLTGQSNDCPI